MTAVTKKSLVLVAAVALSASPWVASAAEVALRTANDGRVKLEMAPEVPERIVEGLRPFQNVRTAAFLDWSQDGRSIYISTRFGDVPQIHRVDMPGGDRRQLTFFDEPVSGAERRPGSGDLVFTMDQGGAEFFQIYRFDPATGERKLLTDGKSRNGGATFSRDGAWMAFRSTRRDGKSNDVWLMRANDPASAALLVQAPDGSEWSPGAFSPDGRELLIIDRVSVNDSRIEVMDLATKERRPVAGSAKKPASYADVEPAFNADGTGIFLVSDQQGDFRQLYLRSLATGEMKPVTPKLKWDVGALHVTLDGKRGAYVVNEDGLDKLYLFDTQSLASAQVDSLPQGVIGSMGFSPDGRRLALTLSSARTPSDVFTIALPETGLAAAAPERWTFSEVGGLDTARFAEPKLVRYKSFDGRQIPAFVYRPEGPGPYPVVITIHGGPEGQFQPGFSADIQAWVSQLGAAVIAPNVRGSTGYGKQYLNLDNGMKREDSVKDIGALLDWIKTQPDLDANRVAVQGGSYGGYMVLASVVNFAPRLRAAVDIVGISNFVTFLQNTQEYRRDLRRVEYGDERDAKMRKRLEEISPSNHVDKMTTPLFVAQGQNDPRVPYTESERIVSQVRAAGQEVWYMKAMNEGHGFRKKENRDLFQELSILFLEQHLLEKRG